MATKSRIDNTDDPQEWDFQDVGFRPFRRGCPGFFTGGGCQRGGCQTNQNSSLYDREDPLCYGL